MVKGVHYCRNLQKGWDRTACINYQEISMLLTLYKILSNILLSSLSLYTEEITGIISMGFNVTDQLLIRLFASDRQKGKDIPVNKFWRSIGL
jgi:hypothetical protein